MKYLKLFENIVENGLENLQEDLRSISYILEDEGIDISISNHMVGPRKLLVIQFLMRAPQKNTLGVHLYTSDVQHIEQSRKLDLALESDHYDEYIDRVEEIAKSHGFRLNKSDRNKHRVYLMDY